MIISALVIFVREEDERDRDLIVSQQMYFSTFQ